MYWLSKNRAPIIGFLFSPLLLLIYAFRNNQISWAKNVVWLFVVYYGSTFVISNPGMDAYYYARQLQNMHDSSLSFSELIRYDYGESNSSIDIIQPIITYLVSRFTSSYSILYTVFGIIFGFFYSRNLWFVFDHLDGQRHKALILPIALLVLVIPFWSLNGVRMWTAAHMFLFGLLNYLEKRDWKYIVVIVSTVLMHFSFLFLVFVFFIYLIIGNRFHLYFILFLLSLAIVQIDMQVFNELITSNLPKNLQAKAGSYANEEYIKAQAKTIAKTNWYVQYYNQFLKWSLSITLVVIYVKFRNLIKEDKCLLSIFSFTLLQYAFANITISIPSFERFTIISNFLVLTILILIVARNFENRGLNRLILIGSPFFLIYILVSLRIGIDTIGLLTIFGNPIVAIFFNDDAAIISLIR